MPRIMRAARFHGEATRLLVRDADLEKVDSVIKSGGTDADVARTTMINTFLGPGRFGKMFSDLDPFRPSVEALIDLGTKMIEASPGDPALNSKIPAGFTYLGQFIDHDLTFDRTPDLPDIVNPDQMRQERTPTLDLDSLYGRGPNRQSGQPELYDRSVPPGRAAFRIGRTSPIPSSGGIAPDTPTIPVSMPNDLPRTPDELAIVADERNDENLIVAQTHLAFLKFHNRVIADLPKGVRDEEDDESVMFTQEEEDDERKRTSFHRARQLVRWHYQWLVLNDFLPKLVDPNVLNDVRTNGRRFYDFDPEPFNGEPFMPIEFSVAAYRLGHSMVRQAYNYNRVFAFRSVEPNAITPATLQLLFDFTGEGGFPAPLGINHPSLPSNWIIDWRRFFEVDGRDLLNFTRKIDTKLVLQLHNLPGSPDPPDPLASLAVRNLLRGRRVGLPTAQDVADAMQDRDVGITPLTPDEIASGDDGETLRRWGFHETTPLWYYVLKEAELRSDGERLGEVGSRIVSEVFVGLLEGDPNSFLSKQPDWKPTLRSAVPGTFTMADLLRFVGDINPIDGG